jgi:hypothetical protein
VPDFHQVRDRGAEIEQNKNQGQLFFPLPNYPEVSPGR